LFVTGLICVLTSGTARAEDRAQWLRDAKWGVMSHYLADWIAARDGTEMNVDRWNRLVDAFDTERLADQLESIGARYYIFTIGQNSGYYLAPNRSYDQFVGRNPSRCSRRDLVSDLSASLRARGIRLLAYLPSGAPARDSQADGALQWQNGAHRNLEFQAKWEQVIRQWSERWGDGVAGWWFDGCYWPNAMYRHDAPNFASFAAAARAGNPDAIVAFNPGVFARITSISPDEDFTAGEINDPAPIDFHRIEKGRRDGAQLHVLSFLGETWGRGEPRFSTDQVVEWSRRIWDQGGAVTWDVPLQHDRTIAGPFLVQLQAIGDAAGMPTRVRSSTPSSSQQEIPSQKGVAY